MNSQIIGTLQGATQANTVDFYSPDASVKIFSCQTNTEGKFNRQVPMGQYKLKVNNSCWATSPNPLTVYLPLQFVTVVAPCTQ